MWNVRRIIKKHLEDMCHVIGMLGNKPLHLECQQEESEEHLQDMCHVIGITDK